VIPGTGVEMEIDVVKTGSTVDTPPQQTLGSGLGKGMDTQPTQPPQQQPLLP